MDRSSDQTLAAAASSSFSSSSRSAIGMALRALASKLRIPAAAPRWTPPPSRPVSTAPKATLGTDSCTSRQVCAEHDDFSSNW
ncbi:hypothetical protein DAI22_07g032500 [Oryza sativa Japonica Group]|nr:hypothetical protein DAI22_07g032500 [Oryza sativa Japonica Group]